MCSMYNNPAKDDFCFDFLRQGFTVPLERVLEIALVDQASPKLTEICLSLPPECWH